ncbi:MAG: hypothetical protein ABIA77_01320 [Candidatus Omnitrophota bacterium]
MTGRETRREKVMRGLKISPLKKMEGIRAMNELSDKVMTLEQKRARRELRLKGM